MDDWVPIDAAPAAAPAADDGWVPLTAASSAKAAAAPAPGGSSVLDFFKNLGGGAVRGLAQFSQDVARGNSPELGGTGTSTPETAPVAANVDKAVGVNPTGTGVGNAIGETLGNPLSYVGPGGLLGKVATGVGSAVGSETLGNMLKGSPYETAGRVIGGFLGGGAPSKAARAITPFPTDATRLGLVNTLKNEGVPVTAGEKTGNMGLRYVENYLKPDLNTPQAEAFTKAALKRAGISADRATPEVMDAAHRDIGDAIETVGARNTFTPDARLGNAVVKIGDDYHNLATDATRAPVVKKYVDDILNGFAQGNGTMPGTKYQQLRSDIARDARGAASDPKTKFALQDLTQALDSAMERSIAKANPADAGAFGAARKNYRNLLVLDRAAGSAGADAANGLISPAQLASATKSLQGKTNFVRGQGDFADLARAGQGVLKPLPDSGTAWRNRLTKAVQAASVGLGTLGGSHYGAPGEGSVVGLLLAEQAGEPILRQGIKHLLMNPAAQRYFGNQALPAVPGLLSTAPLQPFVAAGAGR